MSLVTLFREHTKNHRLIDPGDHILVAVSGGVDSMSLLHLLCRSKNDLNLTLSVVHVDHHLRDDSHKDKTVVQDFCELNNVAFFSHDLDPSSRSKDQSLEEWGRVERYSHFHSLSARIGANAIMTAHHGDDHVETVLMHLSEGTGLDGLKGIRERSGKIVRPLLIFSRTDIENYAIHNKLPFVDDPSNFDKQHPRNFLRHEIIPKLRKRYPHLHASFLSTSDHIHETDLALQKSIEKLADQYVIKEMDRSLVPLASIAHEPISFQVHLLKYILNDDYPWRKHNWNDLKQLIAEGKTGSIICIGDNELLRDRSSIIIKKKQSKMQRKYPIQEGHTINNKEFTFAWKQITGHSMTDRKDVEVVDGDTLPENSYLRPWEFGDQINPLGMEGHKKVSDYLTDIKMDRFSKRDQYVLANGNEVFWLCGQRISDKIKITPETDRFVELSFIQNVG